MGYEHGEETISDQARRMGLGEIREIVANTNKPALRTRSR